MKDKIFGVLQRVGRSFMLPIAILPVAGLFLGIGSSLTSTEMLKAYGLYEVMGPGTILYAFFTVLNEAGDIVFANLPILFAMGVAIGMAKKEKEVAALSGAIAFFIMHATIGALITYQYAQYDAAGNMIKSGVDALNEIRQGSATSVVGIGSLQMGVFGGILVGLGVAALHNRFYRIQLPQVLSFFGGTRFVPIISSIVYLFVGILMYFVWPFIQSGISAIGGLVMQSGYAGTFLYGLMERALIPFGLHHVFYLPFWQTSMGGTMEVAGNLVEGAQNIFFAQLAAGVDSFSVEATRFMSGKFPLMIFGLPGAALAMYRCAKPEKRKLAGSLLLSAGLTAMLTGITEPIEFTFLFVAPVLYVIHCVFAGLAYMLMHVFHVGVGMTFSGGIIDLTLFGILQGNAKTNWIWVVIVGIVYFVVYYALFTFLIKKLNLKTPGREEDTEETKLYTRADVNARKEGNNASVEKTGTDSVSETITRGLGGKKNISDVDCCATRLRCTVHNAELVNDALLKSTGASGVVHKGKGVQVIYGPHVTVIKSNLEDYLETAPNELYTNTETVEVAEEKIEETKQEKVVESILISSPIQGIAADLETAPDEAFASRMMGDGAVVTPVDPIVRAPEDGEVCFIFETKHALGFVTNSGVSLLIHIGIDTVKLNGKGFEVFVENGQKVKKGEPMLKLDLEYLKKNAPSIVSPILCTELADNQKIRLLKEGRVKAGEALFAVDVYE